MNKQVLRILEIINKKQVSKFPPGTKGLTSEKSRKGTETARPTETQDTRTTAPTRKDRRGERGRDTVHQRNPRPTEGRVSETRTCETRKKPQQRTLRMWKRTGKNESGDLHPSPKANRQ